MFIIITKENIEELPTGFLKRQQIETELTYNPFGKYLIYQEKEIFGYLYYSDIYDRVEINQFEVNENSRNCGIGNKLLKEFTETVDKSITLEVREDNWNAIHLYKKYGFVEKAIRKNYYDGKDGILMEKNDNNHNENKRKSSKKIYKNI